MKSLDELKKSVRGMARGKYVVNMALIESQLANLEDELAESRPTPVALDVAPAPQIHKIICNHCGHYTTFNNKKLKNK